MQSQSTDQGIKGKHGYRSMICTLHFVNTKVQIKESNEIQGTDHHDQVAADLYFGFHWISWSVLWFWGNARYRSLICTLGLPELLDLYIGFVSELGMQNDRALGRWGPCTSMYCFFCDFEALSLEKCNVDAQSFPRPSLMHFNNFFFSLGCFMRTTLRSKVLLTLGPCYFRCRT